MPWKYIVCGCLIHENGSAWLLSLLQFLCDSVSPNEVPLVMPSQRDAMTAGYLLDLKKSDMLIDLE
jgi:hypothetical protein